MAYTISYTDVANKGTITIEDGTINTQTSLSLPGRNTTAYGAVIAENFLHLLENFASVNPPENPSEGQLWYNNESVLTDENSLFIYNGTSWVPAGGLWKQVTQPNEANPGDLWVDTDNEQLYLRTGGGFILVGPSFSEGLATGARADQIVGQDNNLYNVLRIEVSGVTVGLISGADEPFSPKSRLPGFNIINPGFNVINRDTDGDTQSNFKFFGTAEKAENLIVNNSVISAAEFLRSDVTSTTLNPINVQNNLGINYGINGELTVGVEGQAGIIQHNVGGSNIDIRVRNSNLSKTVIRVDSNLRVGINTEAPETALDVVGTIQGSENLLINGTTESTTINNGAVIIRGGTAVKKNLNVGGDSSITGLLTTTNIVPDSTGIRSIGSTTTRFSNIYATTFTGNLVGNVSGTISGRASEANKLADRTTFFMEGDVTTEVPIEFDGSYQDADFDNGTTKDPVTGEEIPLARGELPLQKKFRTRISNDFIAAKDRVVDVADDDLILIDDVAGQEPGLKKVTKEDFLKTIPTTPAGIIVPYGGSVAPPGWLICDGRLRDIDGDEELFEAIRYNFGAQSSVPDQTFRLPDLRGRIALGKDDMGTEGSANRVTADSADILGSGAGSEKKLIQTSDLPDHIHDLQDTSNNQYYAYQNRQDGTDDGLATQDGGLTLQDTGQRIPNSGGIQGYTTQTQFDIMPPTMTLNYIIYRGSTAQ